MNFKIKDIDDDYPIIGIGGPKFNIVIPRTDNNSRRIQIIDELDKKRSEDEDAEVIGIPMDDEQIKNTKQKIRGDKRILLSGDPGKGKSEFRSMPACVPITPELEELFKDNEYVTLSIRTGKNQYSSYLLSRKDIIFEEDGTVRYGSCSKQ